MKKVLILTAGFGDGHNAAARNLRDALEHLCDEVKVEVLDLFADTCGPLNTLAQKAYRGLIQFAPTVWGSVHACLDASPVPGNRLGTFARLKNALADILHEAQPDCVVSTYPAYGHAIAEPYRDQAERGFRFLTVVTDSITRYRDHSRAAIQTETKRVTSHSLPASPMPSTPHCPARRGPPGDCSPSLVHPEVVGNRARRLRASTRPPHCS